MNELTAIVHAAAAAAQRGELSLLATVVRVRGSAYRRPGARMLITPSGWQAGGISGGCLESDVLRRAWWRTRDGAPAVVTYDSTVADDADDDLLTDGFGLGCNGVVDVLLERLSADGAPSCPIAFIAECLRRRRSGVMATVIAAGSPAAAVGERVMLHEGEAIPASCSVCDPAVARELLTEARQMLDNGDGGGSRVVTLETETGRVEALVETIAPPTPLLICGAGSDAVPLAQMAVALGWRVTVYDPQPGVPPRPERFPGADAVLSGAPADLAARVPLDRRTLAVVMTHHIARDAALLSALLSSPVRYIGVLGPRRRTERLLRALEADPGDARLHGPVGLDIGADDPQTVALSILAEMQAVLAGRDGGFLRDRPQPIHDALNPDGGGDGTPPRVSPEPFLCGLTTGEPTLVSAG